MGTFYNKGSQILRWGFQQNLKAQEMNEKFLDTLPLGIYDGFELAVHSAAVGSVIISSGILEIKDDNYKTQIKCHLQDEYVLSGVSVATPYIHAYYTWSTDKNNWYVDFVAAPSAVGTSANKLSNYICLGEALFDPSGATITGFDYTHRQPAIFEVRPNVPLIQSEIFRVLSAGDNIRIINYPELSKIAISARSLENDHNLLYNLTADDHPQYLRSDGTRPLTNDWDAGNWSIIGTGWATLSAHALSATDNTKMYVSGYPLSAFVDHVAYQVLSAGNGVNISYDSSIQKLIISASQSIANINLPVPIKQQSVMKNFNQSMIQANGKFIADKMIVKDRHIGGNYWSQFNPDVNIYGNTSILGVNDTYYRTDSLYHSYWLGKLDDTYMNHDLRYYQYSPYNGGILGIPEIEINRQFSRSYNLLNYKPNLYYTNKWPVVANGLLLQSTVEYDTTTQVLRFFMRRSDNTYNDGALYVNLTPTTHEHGIAPGCTLNDFCYVFGGISGLSDNFDWSKRHNKVEMLKLENNLPSTILGDAPRNFYHAPCFAINDIAYIPRQTFEYHNESWKYIPSVNSWLLINECNLNVTYDLSSPDIPPTGGEVIEYSLAYALNGFGYVVGGQRGLSADGSDTWEPWRSCSGITWSGPSAIDHFYQTRTNLEYSPSLNNWSIRQQTPVCGSQWSGDSVGGIGTILGGWVPTSQNTGLKYYNAISLSAAARYNLGRRPYFLYYYYTYSNSSVHGTTYIHLPFSDLVISGANKNQYFNNLIDNNFYGYIWQPQYPGYFYNTTSGTDIVYGRYSITPEKYSKEKPFCKQYANINYPQEALIEHQTKIAKSSQTSGFTYGHWVVHKQSLPATIKAPGYCNHNSAGWILFGEGVNERVYKYDPFFDTWINRYNAVYTGYLTARSLNGKIYYVAGYLQPAACHTYDDILDTVTSKQEINDFRRKHASFSINGKLIICYGREGTSTEVYNFITDTWNVVGTNPESSTTTVYSPGYDQNNSYGYIFGGIISAGSPLSHIRTYNYYLNNWKQKEDLLFNSYQGVFSFINNEIGILYGNDAVSDVTRTQIYNAKYDYSIESMPINTEVSLNGGFKLENAVYSVAGKPKTTPPNYIDTVEKITFATDDFIKELALSTYANIGIFNL